MTPRSLSLSGGRLATVLAKARYSSARFRGRRFHVKFGGHGGRVPVVSTSISAAGIHLGSEHSLADTAPVLPVSVAAGRSGVCRTWRPMRERWGIGLPAPMKKPCWHKTEEVTGYDQHCQRDEHHRYSLLPGPNQI